MFPDDDPDFTFSDSGRCRMTLSVDVGLVHEARLNLEHYPPKIAAQYEAALAAWEYEQQRTAGEMEVNAVGTYYERASR